MSWIVLAVENEAAARTTGGWLRVLLNAGFRRVTLFHPRGAASTPSARAQLEALAGTLPLPAAALDVVELRGDAVQWTLTLARMRNADLVVVPLPVGSDTTYVARLCAESTVPILVLPGDAEPGARLDARPVLLLSSTEANVVPDLIRLIPGALEPQSLVPDAPLPDASMLIMGAAPTGRRLAELLASATRPLLLFPQNSHSNGKN